MLIAIPIYQGVDLLDVAAPYEFFKWMTEISKEGEVYIASEKAGEVSTRDGLALMPQRLFADLPKVDVLWVPGGDPASLRLLMHRPNSFLDFLINKSHGARFIASVCEGALLLAAAGLLDGYEATTHWAFIPCLQNFSRVKVVQGTPRFVIDRNRITGGGISSGLDEALKIIELISSYQVAQSVQQATQYYPCPPVASSIPNAAECPFDWS